MSERSSVVNLVRHSLRRLRRSVITAILAVLLAHAVLYFLVEVGPREAAVPSWLSALLLGTMLLVTLGLLVLYVVSRHVRVVDAQLEPTLRAELGELQSAHLRAEALQRMAVTMSATLSFARVMDLALEAAIQAFAQEDVPAHDFVGAVFLFEGERLVRVASRQLIGRDEGRSLEENGIVAQAIGDAEPVATDDPAQDPELRRFAAFVECKTVVCLPLRAGFNIFGVMIVGSLALSRLSPDSMGFLKVIADQSAIALQNAQLHQDLFAEKLRLIEADGEARKDLARSLHDGPTQSISAIAMQLNFIQSLLRSKPDLALEELVKVEKLARNTALEIRGMLFTLRPLVLETEGLAAAIEAILERLRDQTDLTARLVGGESAELISPHAQSVVFSIVEEALGNARKHARAKNVEVRLWQEGGLFVARVQDDGRGFDVDDVMADYSGRGSLGMVNMRERAQRVDGTVKVDSKSGRGTVVTVIVPLTAQNRREAQPDQ